MRVRNRYIVDSSNRLIIKKNRKKLLTNGSFSVDKNNQLIYWLNASSSWRRQYELPNKIRFNGNWRLDADHNLVLILDESNSQYKSNRLTLRGEIISIDNDSLVFEITSHNKKQGLIPKAYLRKSSAQGTVLDYISYIQLLKLSGSWQADEYNRLTFEVKKKTSPDILTLEGAWQINQNQQITYTYEKTDLKTKTKSLHTLTFEGFWEINSAYKLTYVLSRSSESRFDFRVQIESPNLFPKEGVIKYRLGIGLKGTVPKIISLYGTWKFSRKAGLNFAMDYGKGKIYNIEFGADTYLTKKDKVVFSLTNRSRESLGRYITFTHRFLEKLDAETFLRIKKLPRETGVEAGVQMPF